MRDKILVVDDEREIADLIEVYLKNENYEIRKCYTGKEALGCVEKIVFQNEGHTIPKEKLNAIFEKFYRLDESRTSYTGGAGLGLAIAKEIVVRHGGTITAASADNRVSFTIRIPKYI